MLTEIVLSRMNCYAGKYRVEVQSYDPDPHDKPGLYLQFVEGCNYDVSTLTAEEAEAMGVELIRAATEARVAFETGEGRG